MRKLSGSASCEKDGSFQWRGYYLANGEMVTGKWSDLRKNFSHAEEKNGYLLAYVICPVCNRTITVKYDATEI